MKSFKQYLLSEIGGELAKQVIQRPHLWMPLVRRGAGIVKGAINAVDRDKHLMSPEKPSDRMALGSGLRKSGVVKPPIPIKKPVKGEVKVTTKPIKGKVEHKSDPLEN